MAHPQPEPTFTVFVRLPFPRGDFIDPPPSNWDSSKDEALWSIISRLSGTEVDWNEIANRFEVTVDFLLQQIAWLTERHASQVRAHVRKAVAAARGSSAPSPQPGAEGTFSSEPMRRAGSGDKPTRAPSALSIRKDSPLPRNDGSLPGTPMRSTPRPTATRTSSSNTAVYTTRNLGGSSKAPVKPGVDAQRRRLSSLPITTTVNDDDDENIDQASSSPPELSESEASSSDSSPAQSRIIRRPPRFQGNDAAYSADEEDAEPAFLPYKPEGGSSTSSGPHDLSATLRGNLPRDYAKRHSKGRAERIHQSHTSDSSASSATPSGVKSYSDQSRSGGGPLSPRRTMELMKGSPSGKGKSYSRDSDGTPSMSSSYSDLDDASVTKSALEEALASQMQDGTIGSLRGTISAAFSRSRYHLSGKGNP
ncbi:uncharacterized protein F4822DRAFT_425577 [Hypoxylon trugodes]|uniref:uncharacterized protein n=1 Tax=Hypoxylon trugodes TaxID=326681 RepID=UPI00219D6662|nr:uncharacterized protein F4822DRAFT_425577 [Hypoxylon trugodes]KAI1392368.1 hypothetical protein F4822DRAFT_425577 [Hypoxylon trugodes]